MVNALNNEVMIKAKKKIILSDSIGSVKTFLECPSCGEYHSIEEKLSSSDIV